MEFVFVVPRRALFPDRYPQGFAPFGSPDDGASGVVERAGPSRADFEAVVARHGFFVERARAEVEPEWKQVIPYNVVVAGAEILLLRRTSRGGEARLHHKLTIGVGGHLNPEDLGPSGRDPLERGTARELAEELEIDGPYEVEPIGLINDDSNPVGAVHVGLAQIVRVSAGVAIREKDVLEGRLVRPEELTKLRDEGANFETWSALLVDELPRILARAAERGPERRAASRAPAASAAERTVHGGAGASNAPRR
jgi:predicted NUDIX family phosphoesterase